MTARDRLDRAAPGLCLGPRRRRAPVARIEAPRLELLRGIDQQKRGAPRTCCGSRAGTRRTTCCCGARAGWASRRWSRSAVLAAQATEPGTVALVQVATDAVASLSALFAALGPVERRFVVFIDDLGFAPGDAMGPRHLRSWLDGGVEARPGNVRLAVTSNRRAILHREASEQESGLPGPLNPRDALDDQLALADRFGLSLGFHACSQDEYLAIVRGYAEEYALAWDEAEALEWAKRRGARSGRVAWHFITELAGRARQAARGASAFLERAARIARQLALRRHARR
jgi:predicted AAA+ superfamily ATPase